MVMVWVIVVDSFTIGVYTTRIAAEASVMTTWPDAIFTKQDDHTSIWACPQCSGRIQEVELSSGYGKLIRT